MCVIDITDDFHDDDGDDDASDEERENWKMEIYEATKLN
jgi:hypothetical protein